MTRGIIGIVRLLTVTLAAASVAAAPAAAQHGGGHQHHGSASAEACEAEFQKVIADGRGFGMAFVADKNGYPGPLHVLELAARLGLTPEQETRVRALLDAMYAQSRPRGAALGDAERALSRLFEARTADETAVRAAAAAVERARGELRLVHLLAHLRTRALLTEEQIRAYHSARWASH
jgi:Spy/CpxP family protein refolding chaperone